MDALLEIVHIHIHSVCLVSYLFIISLLPFITFIATRKQILKTVYTDLESTFGMSVDCICHDPPADWHQAAISV